jgi:hypothetical protein
MRRGFFVSFISAVVVARACGAHVVQPSRVRFRSTLGRTVVRALQDADARAKVEREIYLHPEDTPYRMASRPSSAWGLAIANFRRCAGARLKSLALMLARPARTATLQPYVYAPSRRAFPPAGRAIRSSSRQRARPAR